MSRRSCVCRHAVAVELVYCQSRCRGTSLSTDVALMLVVLVSFVEVQINPAGKSVADDGLGFEQCLHSCGFAFEAAFASDRSDSGKGLARLV